MTFLHDFLMTSLIETTKFVQPKQTSQATSGDMGIAGEHHMDTPEPLRGESPRDPNCVIVIAKHWF